MIVFFSSKYIIKILHRGSYSFLSKKISLKLLLSTLLKESFFCWSFSCFLYLIYFCIPNSYITILQIDNTQAAANDISKTIEPNPVTGNVKELDVVAIITDVSNDLNNVVNTVFIVSFGLWFLYLK